MTHIACQSVSDFIQIDAVIIMISFENLFSFFFYSQFDFIHVRHERIEYTYLYTDIDFEHSYSDVFEFVLFCLVSVENCKQ